MKKITKIMISIMLTVCICLIFASCGKSGKSAYEIAVENGFTGTEAEWLESLKGRDGALYNDNKYAEMYEYYLNTTTDEVKMSFIEFLKHISNMSTDDDFIVSVSDAVRGSVAILAYPSSSDNNVVAGSGIICRDNKSAGDAYILTNYHNLYSGGTSKCGYGVYVYLYGGEFMWQKVGQNKVINKNEDQRIAATFIGGSKSLDVAVLKITNSDVYRNSVAKPVTFADNHDVTLGQKVFSVGNPNTLGFAVNSGNVSKVSEIIDISDLNSTTATVEARVIRHSVPTNFGNSGGGLFNGGGKLIGMVNARSTQIDGVQAEGYGYAIPISVAGSVASQVIASYENDGQFVNGVRKVNLSGITLSSTSTAAVNSSTDLVYIKDTIYVSSIGSTYTHTYKLANNEYLKANDVIYGYRKNNQNIYFNNLYELDDLLLEMQNAESITFLVNNSTCTITTSNTTLKP